MIHLFWLSVLVLAAAGLGAGIARLLRLSLEDPLEQFVFWAGFGMGGLAYLTLFTGVVGGFRPFLPGAILVIIVLLSRRNLIGMIRGLCGAVWERRRANWRIYEVLLAALLGIHVVLNGISAFAPLSYVDAMVYHFTIPKQYLAHQGICYLPYMMGNFPLNVQMVYLLGLATGGEATAMLVCWANGVFIILTLYLLARQYISRAASLLAAALLYTTPLVTLLSTSGHVELGLTFFTLLGVFSFTRWVESRERTWLQASAVFIGLAVGTKLYGFASLAVMLAVLGVIWLWPAAFGICWQINLRETTRLCIGFGAIVLAVAGPWMVKNVIYTGNPIYPVLYSVFGARDWSEGPQAMWRRKLEVASGTGRDLLNFVMLPWNLTFQGDRFNAGRTGYGPVLLAFLPALFVNLWRSGRQWPYRFFFFYILFFTLLWFLFAQQRGKHLVPVAPLVSLLVAWTAEWLVRTSRTVLRSACILTLVTVLCFGLGVNAVYSAQFWPVILGTEQKAEFLSRKLFYYDDIEWINQNLPAGAKLVHLEGLLNYYLEVDYIWASEISQGYIDWVNIPDADALLKRFREVGATHLMLNRAKVESAQPHTRLLLEALKARHLKEIYSSTRSVPAFRTLSRGTHDISVQVYEIVYPESMIGRNTTDGSSGKGKCDSR